MKIDEKEYKRIKIKNVRISGKVELLQNKDLLSAMAYRIKETNKRLEKEEYLTPTHWGANKNSATWRGQLWLYGFIAEVKLNNSGLLSIKLKEEKE